MCMNIARQTHTARKRHRCAECSTAILPGEQYVVDTMVEGRELWTWKAHVECDLDANAAEGLREPYECSTYTLLEWVGESGVPVAELGLRPETVARITALRDRDEQRYISNRLNPCFAELPSGRWADDGGPA